MGNGWQNPRRHLIAVSGAVVGGMVVAVFMAVTFVGGMAASIGVIAESEYLASAPARGALSDHPALLGNRNRLQITD